MMISSCGHQIEKNRMQIKQIWSLFIYNTLSYYKKSSILHNTFLTCSTQSRIMSPHDSTKIILLSENESKRHTHIPKWKKKKVQAYMLKHFCFTLKISILGYKEIKIELKSIEILKVLQTFMLLIKKIKMPTSIGH